MTEKPILELKDIKKSFNNVCVLDDVSLKLNPGEVLGLIGENGAGKSTLIKIICGVYNRDAGEMYLNGRHVDMHNPEKSRNFGISTIYQELSLFPSLTVAQNIFINRELGYQPVDGLVMPIDNKKMFNEARNILHKTLQTDIDVNARVEQLTLAEKQMVEIARAIYCNTQIIIMDEPTTALEAREKERLFEVIRDLKQLGHSVIFVSHYLYEVLDICDRVFVLRDGKCVLDDECASTPVEGLIHAMIGKTLDRQYPKEELDIGETIFAVKNFNKKKAFSDISFDLHQREILGIVGLAGCGKSDLLRALFGIHKPDEGEIFIADKKVAISDIQDAIRHKIAFLPADRKTEGIFDIKNVKWNILIATLDLIRKNGWMFSRKENQIADSYVDKLKIKASSLSQVVSSLSGGNQQKVMLARWFLTGPRILLLEEPTRGIDVNVKTEVYKLITQFVKEGNAVIMVSSDEEEVVGICDRILVMRKGHISADIKAAETDIEKIKYFSETNGCNE